MPLDIPMVVSPYLPEGTAYLIAYNNHGGMRDIVSLNTSFSARPAPWFQPVVPDAPKEARPAVGGDEEPRGMEPLPPLKTMEDAEDIIKKLLGRVEELEDKVEELETRPIITIPAIPTVEPYTPYVPYEPYEPWVPGKISDGSGMDDSATITWTDSGTSGKIPNLTSGDFGLNNDISFNLRG